MTHPDHWASDAAASLPRLLDASPALAAAASHVRTFAAMMTRRQGLLALEDWLTQVEGCPSLHRSAACCRWVMSTTTHVFPISGLHGGIADQGTRAVAVSRVVWSPPVPSGLVARSI